MKGALDTANLLLDMMIAGASKEDLYEVIDDFKAMQDSDSEIDKAGANYIFKEPLNTMTTEERCRWFSRELYRMCGGKSGNTEYEEALVFKDAADEIATSNGIIQTQLYLISELKKQVFRG